MIIAIEEARKGEGRVAPNPPVGCVILDKDYKLISKGHHSEYGNDHAEISALNNLSDHKLLMGAHLVVTLEPCAHVGKTPSCAQTLSKLPLASVTYGLMDPNPLVMGKGAEILKSTGIAVICYNELIPELEELIEIFTFNKANNSPFVTLKVATSLDGQMALASGESKWITGTASRQHAHFLRAKHSAVLIGRGTFEMDDPLLNIRHDNFKDIKNKVILFDPMGKTIENLPSSNLYKHHEPQDIFVISLSKKTPPKGITLVKPIMQNGRIDLKLLLKDLYQRDIFSILVEGGANTFVDFIKQNAAQRLSLFIAPSIIGASGGLSWSQSLEISSLDQKIGLKCLQSRPLGEDILLAGLFA